MKTLSTDLVAARLKEKGIERVLVVDDAFDPPSRTDLVHNELADFWNQLELDSQEQLEGLQEPLKSIPESEDEIDDAYVAALYDQRDNLGPLQNAYDKHLKVPLGEKHGHLEPMTEALKNLGLDVVSVGTIPSCDHPPAQLIFLDYYLGEVGVADAVTVARATVRDLLSHYTTGSEKPVVILMSSLDSVNELAEEFRRQTGIVGGMFYFVSKSDLLDPAGLLLNLDMLAMALPHGHLVQRLMDAIETKIDASVAKFLTDIKRLNLDDYVYIQRLSLQTDGHPLGDYLFWLYSAYFGHLLFDSSLGAESRELDRMSFDDWIPGQLVPSTQLAEMYHAALFDTTVGPLGTHPRQPKEIVVGVPPHQEQGTTRGQDEKLSVSQYTEGSAIANGKTGEGQGENEAREAETLPYFNMGDIFHRSETSDVLMVCNPACDLEFTPDGKRGPNPEDSILFIPGTLEKFQGFPSSTTPRTELFEYNGDSYRILWQLKQLRAIKYECVKDWLSEHEFVRIARLRTPFSLEVQQHFASNMTRVGVPVPPPFFRPLQVALFEKGDNGYYKEMAIVDSQGVAYAMATHRSEENQRYEEKCVFTTRFVRTLQKCVSDIGSQVPMSLRDVSDKSERTRRQRANKRIEKACQVANDIVVWRQVSEPFPLPKSGGTTKIRPASIDVSRDVSTNGKWESDAFLVVHIFDSRPLQESSHAPDYEGLSGR